MPYDVKRFIFSVSLCAMLAVNPVLATVPGDEESVGTAHNVYVESNLNKADNGIAGVGYVNRMVDAAGNAAQAAEGHAAAAGKHALSAAKSAAEAHTVLSDKVNIAQGTDNKNKAMVTNASGDVAPGYITSDMISSSGYNGTYSGILMTNSSGTASWGYVGKGMLAEGAVTSGVIAAGAVYGGHIANGEVSTAHIASGAVYGGHITDGAVTTDKIASGAVTSGVIAAGAVYGGHIANGAVTIDKIDVGFSDISDGSHTQSFLYAYETGNGNVEMNWGKIKTAGISDGAVTYDKIANGAVTIDKTAGVVGMVPVGSAGANTYGQFWIE